MNREGLGKISSVGGEFVLGGGEGKKVTADCATEFSPLLLSPLSQVVHLTPRRRRKRKEGGRRGEENSLRGKEGGLGLGGGIHRIGQLHFLLIDQSYLTRESHSFLPFLRPSRVGEFRGGEKGGGMGEDRKFLFLLL